MRFILSALEVFHLNGRGGLGYNTKYEVTVIDQTESEAKGNAYNMSISCFTMKI